ncbi:MFS transporter [Paenibacillus dokdonensis]|uniref:MFS transporter n=1 Tax=Paenibacillus dokdonensis TaxID=2567944 RepID=A0ABU6GHI6_9BACL|nr:MFS transporter [Paenibacillus dokdonensis]MEC0239225.1 MFS transporter [Paenibacillus dokdonensis]
MKTAIWLYMFLFLAFFDLHAQYPILTPFAVSLGAAPVFIGWMMGIYALTHLPGNLIAGTVIDRHGSRRYIIFSLVSAGIVLLLQSQVHYPWQLLVLRSISGFVLAFLSPACLTLLASLSSDKVTQGKFMSGHGVVHTLASVVSPAAGAFIVAKAGYSATFQSLGWLLIATGLMAIFSVPGAARKAAQSAAEAPEAAVNATSTKVQVPWRIYILPFVISCSQGILFFELPLRSTGVEGIKSTGILFSIMSIGALLTLSMLFVNRYSPYKRVLSGILLLAVCFYSLAALQSIPLTAALFVLGMAKGVIFPAMASLFIQLSGGIKLGRVFSLQSIAMSIGSFIGPIAAGQLRDFVSPYFIAFVLLMTGLMLLPISRKPGSLLYPNVNQTPAS